MDWKTLVLCTMAIPIGGAILSLLDVKAWRRLVVILTSIGISASAILLYLNGSFNLSSSQDLFFTKYNGLISVLDFLLLGYILYLGFKFKHVLIQILTGLQILLLALVEVLHVPTQTSPFFADKLSLMMVLIVSILGSLIAIYGLHYMDVHEEHLHLEKSKQSKFFFFLLLFLGAMNGLVLSNNLLWMYFFWEITTLCSFILIGHDQTEIAIKNSQQALWMNLLGGVAFVLGMLVLTLKHLPLELTSLLTLPISPLLLLALAFLCIAGFTKSAQLPFQSWLTGAMVAPTPVSALLHSSTMVNAGVYLILRLAPLYHKTLFAHYLAFIGAFTLIATSVLALSEKNGKKILAYSTIGNLGMIIACAGIGSPAAIGAGILLILFHAVSKGLLFMLMGYVEQLIGSRMIEDMRGLYDRYPLTSVLMAFGMITMFLPPFGALLSKWMIIESSAHNPIIIILLALGSAFTMVFWGKWIGIILGRTEPNPSKQEHNPMLIKASIYSTAFLALILSVAIIPIYTSIVLPTLKLYYHQTSYTLLFGSFKNEIGMFPVYPLFLVFGLGIIWTLAKLRTSSTKPSSLPYMAGLEAIQEDKFGFVGPIGKFVPFTAGNLYLQDYIGETKITFGINTIAIGTIIVALASVF